MKRLLLVGLLILAPAAFGASSVLTSRGLWYSIVKPDEGTSVLLMRRSGGTKVMIDVPATLDGGRNYRAQLDYDRASDRLYVTWVREGANSSDVMMSWLDATGEWSDEIVLASAPGLVGRDGLRTVLTRTGSGTTRTTLIHVASWVRDGEALRGEYLLVAFESGSLVSTSAANFQTLDTSASGSTYGDDLEVFAPYPALAMAALGDGVDVVYGNEHGTSVTRLHISPRLEPNARLWRPVGRSSGMPPARFAATSTAPVRAFFSRDRVVLYTNDRTFRFVIFESGSWSDTQEFTLDEGLTGEALLNQIRRMIEEESPDLVTMSK